MPAIPLPWKVAGVAIVLLVLSGIGLGLYLKGRSDGATAIEEKVAAAVAKQAADDKALSGRLLDEQEKKLGALHARALTSLQKVANAPVTKDCGPVMRDASRGVRDLLRGSAPAP